MNLNDMIIKQSLRNSRIPLTDSEVYDVKVYGHISSGQVWVLRVEGIPMDGNETLVLWIGKAKLEVDKSEVKK